MARKKLMASSKQEDTTGLSEKELALQQMMSSSKNSENEKSINEKNSHRYNIEIPMDLFLEIKNHIRKHGYNLKGFFLAAAKEKIKNET